ncbi:hypothetical protein [Enterococcus larvae]|uniref:hypothetical protein n=1 Tax=Enterococcus larvae TaxID=2794352 RepID=UPI003F33BD0B
MAHYETYDELLRGASAVVESKKLVNKQEESITDDPIKQEEVQQEETKYVTTEQTEPNLAKKNTWLQLTDDRIIEVKQGEQLPAADEVVQTVTQKKYRDYVEAVANEKGDD